MTISERLLPEFDQEMASTRKLLACLPEDKLDFKPHEKSMKLARLAGHVAEMPGWIASLPNTDKLEIPPDWKPAVATSREQLLSFFDDNVSRGRAALIGLSDAELGENWSIVFQWQGRVYHAEAGGGPDCGAQPYDSPSRSTGCVFPAERRGDSGDVRTLGRR